MTIESTLERIATALEKIANSESGLTSARTPAQKAEATKTEVPKTRPGKKLEEKAVEKVEEKTETAGDDFYTEDEPVDIKWPELNKKLFSMLDQVRSALGHDEAKAICATLMKKHSGGQKFSESTVKVTSYGALLADIEEQLEALNG